MHQVRLFIICIALCVWFVSTSAQNSECEIYSLMTTHLKDSVFKSSSTRRHYVWKEKEELLGGEYWGKNGQRLLKDSILVWNSLMPMMAKSKNIECKLDKEFAYKFVKSEKEWLKITNSGKSNWWTVRFSNVLHYEEKQAFCHVMFRWCVHDVRVTYWFFFEKENEKWKIRKIEEVFRV